MPRIITVTSGKGGVGKTNISLNLSIQLARFGYRTCLFDADLGLANVAILLSLKPEATLEHVIEQEKRLDEILIHTPSHLDIIPGASGVPRLADIDQQASEELARQFSLLDDYDYFIIDTASGIARNNLAFSLATDEIVIVVTPEPTSLTDAYALLKMLHLNGYKGAVNIVVNQCKTLNIGKHTYEKFEGVVKNYLSVNINLLAILNEDNKVNESVVQQKPFVETFPDSRIARGIFKMANEIVAAGKDAQPAHLAEFFEYYVKLLNSPLTILDQEKQDTAKTIRKTGHKEPPAKPEQSTHTEQPVSEQAIERLSKLLLEQFEGRFAQLQQQLSSVQNEVTRLQEQIKQQPESQTTTDTAPAETPAEPALDLSRMEKNPLQPFIGEILTQIILQNGQQAMIETSNDSIDLKDEESIPLEPGRYQRLTIKWHNLSISTQSMREILNRYLADIHLDGKQQHQEWLFTSRQRNYGLRLQNNNPELTILELFTTLDDNLPAAPVVNRITPARKADELLKRYDYETAEIRHQNDTISLYSIKQSSGKRVLCTFHTDDDNENQPLARQSSQL